MKKDVRYFIVDEDSLGMYGDMDGSDKERAEVILSESTELDNLVVIKGEIIHPTKATKFVLP